MKLELISNGVKLYGKCKCGHKEHFRGDSYKLDKTDINNFILRKPFQCPQCKKEYHELEIKPVILERKETDFSRMWGKLVIPILSLLIVVVIGFGIKYLSNEGKPNDFYNTGNVSDMTDEDYNDFNEWKEKQNNE